jgi:hypothetical protein
MGALVQLNTHLAVVSTCGKVQAVIEQALGVPHARLGD